MKSNNAKYFIALLGLTLSITSINSYALKFSDLMGYNMNDFNISSKNSIGIKQSLCKFDDSTVGGAVLPTIPITKAQGGFSNYSNSKTWYRSVGVRWSIANGNINFELYDYDNNQRNSVVYPVSGINYTFRSDGQTVLLDNVYFYYNTVILFDDAHTHSLQLINDNAVENLIIFVDFLQNTYDNSGDNLYLIDFHINKAWSLFLSDTSVINDLFYGRLDNYPPSYFYDLPYNKSYTLYEISSSPWIPSNSNIRSKLNTSCYSFYQQNDTGFTYSLDTNFIAPDFDNGGGNNSGNGSGYYGGNAVDYQAVSEYNTCVDEITTIQDLAILEDGCRVSVEKDCQANELGYSSCMSDNDFNNMYDYLKNTNGSGGYTGNVYGWYCVAYYNKAVELSNGAWSGENGRIFARRFLTANSWSAAPRDIDISSYCGTYPNSGNPSSEQSWLCRLTGIGCNDSLGQIFDIFKQNLLIFYKEPIDFLTSDFNRGYNYFGTGYQCVNMYGNNKSYSWGNYLLMFVLGRLGFILYSVFKD